VSVYEIPIDSLEGESGKLAEQRGNVTLIVNVASQCGLTPQYGGLQNLQNRYGDQGFSVVGVPCNQFLGQEPGTPKEIATFCETSYGVTFPLFEKIDVNGDDQHPLYAELNQVADAEGHTGDIRWNFEKFLVDDDGTIIARFAPQMEPESDEIVSAIEEALDDES
jgi:glutathione peroxidase